jgi:hypothetical protein
MNYKNASYNKVGSIDCEIEHPVFGWIPFTASPDDVEETGREVFAAAQATATAYVEPPADLTALAEAARAQRNVLLQQSDWTQVADAPVDQAAWATYRQALRDITAQAGFPETINWPVAPE